VSHDTYKEFAYLQCVIIPYSKLE